MTDLNLQLFYVFNLQPQGPGWSRLLAELASTVLPSALVVGVCSAWLVRQSAWRRTVLLTLLAMLLAWLVSRGLSALWPTSRPFALGLGHQWLAHKPTASFPSSHASVAFAFGCALWSAMPHRLGRWLPLGLALLVSWSRVALGLHFPLDVVAGAAVGWLSWQTASTLMLGLEQGRSGVWRQAPAGGL